MKCVILQPSYIPWRGYFHQIYKADLFIFYDDVQYDKHGWRNRNRIKTPQGSQWLTVPILSSGVVSGQIPINMVQINRSVNWVQSHLKTLKQNYGKSPFFVTYESMLAEYYQKDYLCLADFTIDLTIRLARELGITHTSFLRSSDIPGILGSKTERLINILQHVGAKDYISGPSAASYLDEELLSAAGIQLEYVEYSYPEYPQLFPPFDPYVSILDLMFSVGPESLRYIVR